MKLITRKEEFLDCLGGGMPLHQCEEENDYIDEQNNAELKLLEVLLTKEDHALIMTLLNTQSISTASLCSVGDVIISSLRNYGRLEDE